MSSLMLTMCYFIETNTSGVTYDYNKAATALDLASYYANEMILPPEIKLTSVYRNMGSTCGEYSHVVSEAFAMRDNSETCDVYIGPACGTTVETLNNIASVWNIPIIGCPASELGLSAPASDYTIVSRTSITYVSITMVLMRFLNAYNYTTPVVFQDQSVGFFKQLGILMQFTVYQKSEVLRYGVKFIPFASAADSPESIQQQLKTASLSSRCFVLCADALTVRKIMVWADGLGMTKGDYIFMAVELYPSDVWGAFTWQYSDTHDSVAREAYHSLAILSLKSETTEDAAEFWRQVIKLSREKYHYEFTHFQQAQIDPVVAHFYDAVLLYANVVVAMSSQAITGNYSSGLDFCNAVANYSFLSPVSGLVSFNADSDRLLDYEIRFFNDLTGKHDAVLGFPATTSTVEILGDLVWMGQPGLPVNTPHCGFKGENLICAPEHRLSGGAKAGIAVAVVLFITGLAIGGYSLVQRLMFSNMDPYWWRMMEQDLVISSGARSAKSMTSSFASSASGRLLGPQQKSDIDSAKAASVKSSKPGKTAAYNGVMVSLLELPEPKLRVPPNMARDAFLVRSMQHNNVQTFIGVAVNDANLCDHIVGEICQKGTLQDLIGDTRTFLDWEFKNSLIKGLTNGMIYIHSSPIQSHGFLSDATCQIDSRFILKIGGYGFDCLRQRSDLEAYHSSQAETRNIRLLLWRAPELLRRAMPPAGTQKGDAYSYAILLQQIVLRTDPFQRAGNHPTGKENTVVNTGEIIHEVCRGLTPPLRPPVPMSACSHEMHTLMESCWDEDPVLRPTFLKIRGIIQNTMRKSGDNIVDHLINRMEKNSAELENQVLLKTKEFLEERHRTAALFQELLPKSINEALEKGLTLLPETFPSVTVYFGTVVGFKEQISLAKTPRDMVTMLNNLFGLCDGVISGLDVFKAAVVEDAYLVVSGLPVRNGQKHVEQIADMALQLRREISTLLPSTTVKLRAGIHSGPCVAAVVGLKLPRYCLFGDTVNTCMRMESHGEAGKLHVSGSSKALLDLHDDFVLVERGLVNVKGKGETLTYWLVGRN